MKRKRYSKININRRIILIGGIIGFIVGLLPVLLLFDVLEIEFLIIFLVPISLVSKNMLFVIFSTPIFYAIVGILIGLIINNLKKKK